MGKYNNNDNFTNTREINLACRNYPRGEISKQFIVKESFIKYKEYKAILRFLFLKNPKYCLQEIKEEGCLLLILTWGN